MATEIERKFLIKDDRWKTDFSGVEIAGIAYRQGYLSTDTDATVRVRRQGDQARLTIKGKTQGISRAEYEYPIPLHDANEMLDTLCRKPQIEKIRYRREEGGLIWEIDVFVGDNAGLVVAEVELESESQLIDLPAWVGQEVTGDDRYYNVNLVSNPFKNWS